MSAVSEPGRSRVACIIPAFNEGARIGAVLDAVVGHPMVDEVIVVDDGSTDQTASVVSKTHGVRLIIQPTNQGKTRALLAGFEAAAGDLILLLDADLEGLTPDHLTRLLQPVLSGRADISISLRQNAPRIWRLIGIDYISGERVLHKSLLAKAMAELTTLPNFGFEVFLNQICVTNACRIAVVQWPGVSSPFKKSKYGLITGIRSDIRMMRDIFRTIPPLSLVGQIWAMRRLRLPFKALEQKP